MKLKVAVSLLVLLNVNRNGHCAGGEFKDAAIAVDSKPCAQIGMDVLRRAGSAVDAAVAAEFCVGIYSSWATGLGGGHFMTIYSKSTNEIVHLNARETAPSYASEEMYEGIEDGSIIGPNAAATPGQVVGLWEAKQRFGNPDISWASLIEPSINMCFEGIEVGFKTAEFLDKLREDILADPGLSSVFVNPSTGDVWQEGDYFTWDNMGLTLQRIADNGADEVTGGQTAMLLVEDIQAAGGNMTMEDLASFYVTWEDPLSVPLPGNTRLYTSPLPGSGAVLAYIMNIIKHYNFGPEDESDPVTYQRMTESFKWGYGRRSELGDPFDPAITDYVNELVANMTSEAWALNAFSLINDTATVNDPTFYGANYSLVEDHGTSHLSVVAPNGDAVALTSTQNLAFGARFMSPSTGIILNDEMDDFSYPDELNNYNVPPSPNNYPIPGKRPLSSMAPSIIVDSDGDVKMVAGSAGGTMITTTISYITLRKLWFEQTMSEAIDTLRIHHQLEPMEVKYEEDFDQGILDYLTSCGHNLSLIDSGSVATSIARVLNPENEHILEAYTDARSDGAVDGF